MRIGMIGNYPPRRCGIATFTFDLANALLDNGEDVFVSAMRDNGEIYVLSQPLRYILDPESPYDYVELASYLNQEADIALLQHEYGIFGGDYGRNILMTLEQLSIPLVSTFHTVLANPDEHQLAILRKIAARSTKVVCMTQRAVDLLTSVYSVPAKKIMVIPHGVHPLVAQPREESKVVRGWSGKKVVLTFGLLSPDKGIQHAIEGIAEAAEEHPDIHYVVAGRTHPHIRRHSGEAYRESLMARIEELGLGDRVEFIDKFIDLPELLDLLNACDVYVTPYTKLEQITSGTLSYAVGAGRAVVSTPYWHASELLANGVGVLVPPADGHAIGQAISELLRDSEYKARVEAAALAVGDETRWTAVGASYVAALESAREHFQPGFRAVQVETDRWSTRHLEELTDDTGVLQHARFDTPKRSEGYCTDDNARALSVVQRIAELSGWDPALDRIERTALSFLENAVHPATGKFRNFMSYDRQWLEECGSEESQARAFAALARSACKASTPQHRSCSLALVHEVLPGLRKLESPRALANVLVGLCDLWEAKIALPGTQAFAREIANQLNTLLAIQSSAQWQWYEPYLTYDNGKLTEAMLRYARAFGDEHAGRSAISALAWLSEVQRGPNGIFLPIGNDGFWRQGEPRAVFCQQPIEVWSMLLAYEAAHDYDGDPHWVLEAQNTFAWFFGKNVARAVVAMPDGAFDGLGIHGPNQNRGAESTLAYLGSATVMAKLCHGTNDAIMQIQGWS